LVIVENRFRACWLRSGRPSAVSPRSRSALSQRHSLKFQRDQSGDDQGSRSRTADWASSGSLGSAACAAAHARALRCIARQPSCTPTPGCCLRQCSLNIRAMGRCWGRRSANRRVLPGISANPTPVRWVHHEGVLQPALVRCL